MKAPIFAVALFLLLPATFASAQVIKPFQAEYYPLKQGQSWTYRVTDLKKTPVKVDDKITVKIEVDKEETYTRKTTGKDGKKIVDEFTGYLLKNTGGQQSKHDHVVVLEDGVYRVETAKVALTPPLQIFKLPLKDGETWEANSTIGKGAIKGTFTAKYEKVTVPAGAYDAWVIRFRSDPSAEHPFEFTNWFVKDIGMVKSHVKSKDHERLLELQSYSGGK